MSGIATSSVILGINDSKIAELTSDSAAGMTYGAGVDVPGITSLKVSPTFIEKELRGDETVLDQYSRLDYIDWSFENSIMSLAALAIILGGDVEDAGETPNRTQTYTVLSSSLPKYFKLEGKSDYADVGDVHIVLPKCKCNKVEYTLTGEDYAKVSASGRAIGTVYNKQIKRIVFNETATDISVAAADSISPTVSATPNDGASNVDLDTNIAWTFSEEIQANCVTQANFMLIKASDGSSIDGTLSKAGATIVTFAPEVSLETSTDYIAIATTNIKDLAGNALAANFVVNFTTAVG